MYKVLHDFQSMTLLDKIVGDSKRGITIGVPKSRVTSPSLRSTVNLANPRSYADPGAAPNGADFVPLQKADGTVLEGRDLRSLNVRRAPRRCRHSRWSGRSCPTTRTAPATRCCGRATATTSTPRP